MSLHKPADRAITNDDEVMEDTTAVQVNKDTVGNDSSSLNSFDAGVEVISCNLYTSLANAEEEVDDGTNNTLVSGDGHGNEGDSNNNNNRGISNNRGNNNNNYNNNGGNNNDNTNKGSTNAEEGI